MPQITTYRVKAIVENGKVKLDLPNKKLSTEIDPVPFEEGRIVFNAQEVSRFNESEMESVKMMGNGCYTIDFKIIT